MPGLVGVITKNPRAQAEQELLRMVESIRHDASYRTGTWVDESAGVYVGWSARNGTSSEAMPLSNERGDVVLVFSGEEFPEPGTARRLQERGHALKPEGPSYLVHAYEEDPAFFGRLNGRFQGLLADRAKGTVTLFNDRFGLHRLYYHQSKDAFYFAVEAKAILAARPELRRADLRSLGEFVSCGCVLENRSLFEGVHVLPGASAWVFRNGVLEEKRSYFHPDEWKQQEPLAPEAYFQELRRVFSENLPRYFNGHQPIGMSLTGGLDTRMIMAWHKAAPGSLPCYSFAGMYRDCQDVLLARQVAGACGQSHESIPVGEEFLAHFPHYAERAVYLADGCVTVTRASDLYANQRAAAIAPVRMTGNYGGEILRRVVMFKAGDPARGLFHPDFLPRIREAQQTYASQRREHALAFIAFRQTPWYHYGLLALEETQLSLRSPFLDNDVVRTAFRAPGASEAKKDIFVEGDDCPRLISEGSPALQKIRTDRGFAGDSGPLASAISRNWLEFTFKAEYAYDYGMPQWLARTDHLVSWLHLERLFLGRHKFNHYRVWYRDALSGYVREMLLDSRCLSRPYLVRENVESMVRGHLQGDHNYTSEIHSLLTLELVHRLFFDRN